MESILIDSLGKVTPKQKHFVCGLPIFLLLGCSMGGRAHSKVKGPSCLRPKPKIRLILKLCQLGVLMGTTSQYSNGYPKSLRFFCVISNRAIYWDVARACIHRTQNFLYTTLQATSLMQLCYISSLQIRITTLTPFLGIFGFYRAQKHPKMAILSKYCKILVLRS